MGDSQPLKRLTEDSPSKAKTKMKTLLILCIAVAAAVAKPQYGDDCADCVNHCKTVKKIEYVKEYEDECHNEHRQQCDYKVEYKEECTDKKMRVCEKFWKEDPYG